LKTIPLRLGLRSYDIIVGYGITPGLGRFLKRLKLGSDAYIITNTSLKARFGPSVANSLKKSGRNVRFKVVPDTEESKSMAVASLVINDLASYDRLKRVFIIALGGGVIGDLAGFVASVYKRGIPYIQVPTSLLAQIDSAIGGKTGVDLEKGKNLVGAFYQPRLVFADVKLLKSLSRRQVSAGLAEAIKYAVIKDKQLFSFLEKNLSGLLALNPKPLEFVVARCASLKAAIVSKDEREARGIRTVLNFGHTLGHAIEAAGRFKAYNHGEAVGLGMLAAMEISVALGLTDEGALRRVEALIQRAGLPVRIKGVSPSRIVACHYHDKKFVGKRNLFVLSCGIGKTKIVKSLPLEVILRAVRKRIQSPTL
jgi:3-dehydroquinate synthase